MIILLGSTGMVGAKIKAELEKSNHDIWAPTRQWLKSFAANNNHDILHQELASKIQKNTIIINTIGIAPGFGDKKHKEVYNIQKVFLDACLAFDIQKIISLSALSNHPNPDEIPYLHYKYALDNDLLAHHPHSYIVRPSLIYADNGASTQFFKMLAKSPLLAFPNQKSYTVSPIDAKELIQFIIALLPLKLPSQVFEIGSETITISNYLKCFNPKLIIAPLPEWMMRISMNMLGLIMPSVAGKYAFALLKVGSTNQRDDFYKIMGKKAQFPHINQQRECHE